MSGAGSFPNLTIVPPPVGIEHMSNEPPSQYIFDQGLSYPAPDNFGFLPTGYEPPGDWGDHRSIYGLDGQDLRYMGLQAESMPYIYYTPGYGYAQAPFNQYTSYVPGAVSGLEGTLAGVQPYVNIPPYQPTTSSSAYVPVIVQPSSDLVPASYNYPLLVGNGASIASGLDNAGAKIAPPLLSAGTTTSSQLASLETSFVISETSQPSQRNQAAANPSEGLQISIPESNQSLLQETRMHGAGPLEHPSVSSSQMQSTYQFSHGRIPLVQNHVNFAAHSNSGLTDIAPSALGWSNQEKGNQIKDTPSYMIRNPDALGEQNSRPRKNRLRDQSISSVVETAELNQNSATDAQEGSIVISPDNYNKDDFPVDYPDAKFFVIKSYSEDDVHKSVKYNVWSSTHNGNRRLDSAYAEAQRIGKSRKCPVLLFFSVNASGQFCGVAEMDGPVDFDRDMNFWQQDKWSGSFPVKWHIIKDVPNANLRHIILENNENKPVTNSRDTQEIPYSAGINMLKVFKTSLLRTSILDDFMFYEDRQKKMLEDKFRRHGRIYDASLYVPAHVSQNMPDGKAEASNVDDSQPSGTRQIAHDVVLHIDAGSGQSSKNKEKMPDDSAIKSSRRNGKQPCVVADQSLRTDGKQPNAVVGFTSNADWRHFTDINVLVPKENRVQICSTNHPPKSDKKQSSQAMNQLQKEGTRSPSPEVPSKVDGKQSKWIVSQPPSSDESTYRTKDVNSICKAGSCEEQCKSKIHASECSSNKDSRSELDEKQLKWRISRPPSSDGSTDRLQDVNGVGKANSGEEQFKNKICASESSSNRDNLSEIDEKQRKWKISQPPSSDGSITRPKDVNGVCKAGFSEERLKNIVHSSESSFNKDTQAQIDGKQSKWRIRSPLSDGSTNKPKDVNGACKTGSAEEQFRNKIHASESSSNKDAQSEDKQGLHSLYPNKDATISLGAMEVKVDLTEFVTIGSVQVKVKDLGESSRVSGAGTLPSESNGPKLRKKGALTNS